MVNAQLIFAENFILRWGTHYIKSGKFGGRLQIFKTMDASQVSSKAQFSEVMEIGYKSLFSSFHAKYESGKGNSAKSLSKTSSTSISVEGGDQKIAAIITDFNSPTIKYDLTQWLASIPTFPKPFKFMVAPIIDLLKFNPLSLFTDEERDWGCEARAADMKEDPETRQNYYEVKVNGTLIKKFCPYKDRDDLIYLIERKRNGLERAINVYMEEVKIVGDRKGNLQFYLHTGRLFSIQIFDHSAAFDCRDILDAEKGMFVVYQKRTFIEIDTNLR